jgi:thymidylate synthase (FAD)
MKTPTRRVGTQPTTWRVDSDAHRSTNITDPEQLTRSSAPLLDIILGQSFAVLDDGFVRVIDYMGNDAAIVQAARVSYGTGTKHVQSDRGLIRYLMRQSHTTPFEMCEIKLHVRVPMDTWRQWIRHRTANVNEYSTRYSLAIDAAQRTAPGQWRTQSTANRQGSGSYLRPTQGKLLSIAEQQLHKRARREYEARIAAGVAREQARKDLPLSTYTEAYWKIDLHNLIHFLMLRMDAHAQQEIRAYATLIGEEIVAKWVPMVWEAFLDYRRGAVHLSRIEAEIMGALILKDSARARGLAAACGLLTPSKNGGLAPNRERLDLESKLRSFGLKLPWK